MFKYIQTQCKAWPELDRGLIAFVQAPQKLLAQLKANADLLILIGQVRPTLIPSFQAPLIYTVRRQLLHQLWDQFRCYLHNLLSIC